MFVSFVSIGGTFRLQIKTVLLFWYLQRYLKPKEVVDVFDQSLGQDENGSVYTVLPGVPTLDFPNVNKFLLLASAIAGKLVVLCRPQTKLINATHIFMILMLAFFGLNPFISGVLFHHYLLK